MHPNEVSDQVPDGGRSLDAAAGGSNVCGYPAQPVIEPGGSQLSGELPFTVLLLSGTVPENVKMPPP
jgi:hypothetical protein